MGVAAFVLLQFVAAPYGRHAGEGWGPRVPNKAGWVVMEATVAASIVFNAVNGFLLGHWFARFADYPDDWVTDPRFLVGPTLFVGGLALNW